MMDALSTWTSSVQLHRRQVHCRPCGRRSPWSALQTPTSDVWPGLDPTDDDSRCQHLQIHFELGHVAILRSQVTSDGHTHDWEVYVRPSEGASGVDALSFIERVEFQLHETYDRRTVVLNEAPFHVVESGYGGFLLPVDIFLRTACEPRRLRFFYDLQLDSSCSVASVRYEKVVFWNPAEPLRSALRKSGAVSYVSRWRSSLTPSAFLSSSSSSSSAAAGNSAAYSSGYCSNCSELHDSKTPLRLLDLQRRQRTCRSDDVMRTTSLSNMLKGSNSQQPSVKHELNSSMQDVKPDCAEGVEGSKTAFTFLQTWLRQVTSDKDQSSSAGAVPQLASRSTAGTSKRRKGRPRKYVAAAGDRTLTGDALLVDTASDSGLARFAVIPHAPPPLPVSRPATNLTADQPAPAASQGPSTSGGITPAVKRAKVGRRKDSVFQRGRRQPVKFIPAADRRPPPVKPRRSRSSTVSSTPSQAPAPVRAVDGSVTVKRPRGRPRKHPVVSVPVPARSIPAGKKAASNVAAARQQLTDVEGDSSDSDVIVTAYIAPRNTTSGLREPTRETPALAGVQKRNETTGTTNRGQNQRRISQQTVNTEVTQPVKRKRGRPRKYPLPTNATAAVNSSSGRHSSSAAVERPAAVDRRRVTSERRRVTRALTATQLQNEWNATRLTAAESSTTPARNTPPLYYELSSSDNEEPAPDFRSDVDRRPNNFRRKRKRRQSIPSRSLELSFSSIEKDDVSSGEGAYNLTSGRSCDRESYRAAEMTSTPRYDRSLSTRDSTLRSRWINVEQRAMEMTTTAVVHRDADGKSSSTTIHQGNTTRSAAAATAASQCSGSAVVHRRRRRRGRSSDNEDPDWRRYPTKPARRPSRNDLGPASTSTGPTSPVMTSHSGSNNEPPMYDEAELDVLVELQRRLASTSDGHVLRQVVEIIEASGRYHVEDATFDFDLCSLDRTTIAKLRRCLGV